MPHVRADSRSPHRHRARGRPSPGRGGRARVTVLVPVLDEAGDGGGAGGRVARRARRRSGARFEIVFVDDGSRDGTPDRIRAARARDPRVKLVRLRRNFGKAAALTAGFDHRARPARDHHGRRPPGRSGRDPALARRARGRGARPGLGLEARAAGPASKTLPSRLFNWVTRRLAQVDLHDFNCGFKVYRREVLEQIAGLRRAPPLHPGAREPPRLPRRRDRGRATTRAGTASRSTAGTASTRDCSTCITVLFITKYTRRPLHLFGSLGLIAFGAGFAIDSWLALPLGVPAASRSRTGRCSSSASC